MANKFSKQRPKYTPPARCHSVPPGPPRWPGDYDVPKRPTLLVNLILPRGTSTALRELHAQTWLYPTDPTAHSWFGIARAADGSDYQVSITFHAPLPGASATIVRLSPGPPSVAGTNELPTTDNQGTFVVRWQTFATSNAPDASSWPRLQILS